MADVYFRVNLFFVRMAGVPIKARKFTLLNSAYNEILAACYYVTYLSITLDFVFKEQELHESMKNVRMICGMAVVAMMHLYLRYRNYVYRVSQQMHLSQGNDENGDLIKSQKMLK
jgi:hypothetical protein